MTTAKIITDHAGDRGNERYGFSKKQTESRAASALKYGKRLEDFETESERRFLEKRGREGSFAIAYNKKCFIYSECNVCITTYRLPVWFDRKEDGCKKAKKNNHNKSFCLYSDDIYDYEGYAV